MADSKTTNHSVFPPVIAVLGHVDHGKTTLLDAIRSTAIADREHGGITQKIGASSVIVPHEGSKRKITFIDTPGHEAFSKMRGRGAIASDIGLLIVSAVDGVQPQTKESIQLLKESNIPFVVVFTKSDMPTKNLERAKQQIIGEEILLEGLGGDVPYIEVSAKTNTNIKELLDLILLVQDLHGVAKNKDAKAPLEGIVIESKMDQKAGPKATVIIKNGTIRVREEIHLEGIVFKVRTLISDAGLLIQEATVGDAVEILGITKVPSVGTVVTAKEGIHEYAKPTEDKKSLKKELIYMQRDDKPEGLPIVLCADTQGSLEAITFALPKEVAIVSKKTGEITEADVLLAKSTGAIVLGFNIKIRPDVAKLAQAEKVLARNYTIIYEMLDEIRDVVEGKRLALLEEVYGTARIMAKFPFEKGFAFGISVIDGRVARGDKIRVMRDETVVGEVTIASLRVNKESVSKVEKGKEGGILFNQELDITIGDMLICHS